MDEATTGGFWGDDGFTFEDVGSIIDLTADTTQTLGDTFGWFGDGSDVNYTDNGDGTYAPESSTAEWVWWVAGALALLIIIALIYWYVQKKQGKK